MKYHFPPKRAQYVPDYSDQILVQSQQKFRPKETNKSAQVKNSKIIQKVLQTALLWHHYGNGKKSRNPHLTLPGREWKLRYNCYLKYGLKNVSYMQSLTSITMHLSHDLSSKKVWDSPTWSAGREKAKKSCALLADLIICCASNYLKFASSQISSHIGAMLENLKKVNKRGFWITFYTNDLASVWRCNCCSWNPAYSKLWIQLWI